MLEFTHVAIIIVLFIVLLLVFPICFSEDEEDEHFDTYYNHDMGVHEVYQKKNPKMTVAESGLNAKYRWDEKTKSGDNVYDKYYEDEVNQRNSKYAPRVGDPMNSGGDYDTKFNNGAERGNGYDIRDMHDNMLFANFYHPNMTQKEDVFKIELNEKIM